MLPRLQVARAQTRRQFLKNCQTGIGSLALASLLNRASHATGRDNPMSPVPPHFLPKAKKVIYLHMSGAPPQHDLFDYKPKLNELHLQPCPESLLTGQRFAFIKGHPKLLGTPYKFKRYGQTGTWVSELMPHLSELVDELAFVKSMNTDQFNHAPAELFLYTGSPRNGGAAMGSWITASAPRTKTCRASSCSSAAAPIQPAEKRCGVRDFFRPSIKAFSVAR
jgi:hypothetical protein